MEMQQELFATSNFQGFLVYIANYDPGYNIGFYSGNHKSRTLQDLGYAPRLLLKVNLPSGFTTDDVQFNTAHSDGKGGNYLGFRYKTSTDWPAEWQVANR
jgi:hypothetical protein